MSRRRVSVKDLGVPDCQGWLHRRKESRSFLGSRWKKHWFVLKKSSLYWYRDQLAEEAEGFIDLSGFSIDPARQSRKKHAMTASRPQVVTLFIAAENFTAMTKWIRKLSEAAETRGVINAEEKHICEERNHEVQKVQLPLPEFEGPHRPRRYGGPEECYSEGSDEDDGESASTSCSLSPKQETAESKTGNVSPAPLESPSCSLAAGHRRRRSSSEGASLCRNRRGTVSEGSKRRSWQELPGLAGVTLHQVHETPPDDIHPRAARLSVVGQPGQRDFSASFSRRCSNEEVNEKLHLLRVLSSSLKAKEAELLAVEQILGDPTLTAPKYRTWRRSNLTLLQEIIEKGQAAGGARGSLPAEQLRGPGPWRGFSGPHVVEQDKYQP